MIFSFLFTIICSKLTFSFHKNYMVTSVQASTIATLSSLLFLKMIDLGIDMDFELYSKLAFGASFVGMSCPRRFSNFEVIVFSAIFYILYHFLIEYFPFSSGLLGFLAFISVIFGSRTLLLSKRKLRLPLMSKINH